jgi:hypothetical protein
MTTRPVTPVVGSTATIQDPSVRRAIDAVVGAWRVRNGELDPKSDDRFITLGELKEAVKGLNVTIESSASSGSGSTTIITGGGSVGQDLQDLVDYLQTTELWLDLLDRITLIDGPTGSIVNLDGELAALGITVNGHTISIGDIVIDISDINNISGGSGSVNAVAVYNLQQTVTDPATGLAKAHADIAQINFVDVTSTSAIAGTVAQMSATVNGNTQDIQAAEAAITQINTVSAGSTSANAVALYNLTGQVNDPNTGLPRAHAEIGYINNVSVSSNSAAARDVATLKATVYTPTTGVMAQIDAINNVSVGSNSANAVKTATLDAAVNDPNTGLSRSHARISEEATVRVNSDNALAQQLNMFWAQLGGNQSLVAYGTNVTVNPAATSAVAWTQVQSAVSDGAGGYVSSAAVKVTAETAYSIANGHSAQYTVKLDVNGYVNGFGLMNSGSNGAFYVNANTFYLGAGGVSPGAPFIATQTGTTVNGKYYPPGVWMNAAYIGSATIDFAQITDTIQSNNWNWAYPGTGWRIYKDGNAYFNNLTARGNITANSLDVNTANIVSTLHLAGNTVTLPLTAKSTVAYYNDAYPVFYQPAVYMPVDQYSVGQKLLVWVAFAFHDYLQTGIGEMPSVVNYVDIYNASGGLVQTTAAIAIPVRTSDGTFYGWAAVNVMESYTVNQQGTWTITTRNNFFSPYGANVSLVTMLAKR